MGILLLTLTALGCGNAWAGGRAACRAEFGLSARLACYAEQVAWSWWGGLEVAVGLDLRWPGPQLTPYSVLAYYGPEWWAALELGRSVGGLESWRWAMNIGFRWR
ncbi:MAG: hypothetical protein RMK51_03635 [Meiothermus sp.]|uniref:hypothetical protein n=1 Tax=Meiothermus sp. TaxID=1955249 RepID=UPI0025D70C2A|nr:hypothetical protein [Meiothermus sp.]MCS7069336.1 hypothetical protein [Meiothermus sp.]MDW8425000.1 hypothetical protein [Meiothermus sp.]